MMRLSVMRVALIVALVFLAGCTTYWYRPGTSQAQAEQDIFECELTSYSAPQQQMRPITARQGSASANWQGVTNSGISMMNVATRGRLFERCMEVRGYHKGPKERKMTREEFDRLMDEEERR